MLTPDHIVIVIEENQQQMTIIGNTSAPYTNVLARNGVAIHRGAGALVVHPAEASGAFLEFRSH